MISVTMALLGLVDAWAYPCHTAEDYTLAEQLLDIALEQGRLAVAVPADTPQAIDCLRRILGAPRGSEELANAVDRINETLTL